MPQHLKFLWNSISKEFTSGFWYYFFSIILHVIIFKSCQSLFSVGYRLWLKTPIPTLCFFINWMYLLFKIWAINYAAGLAVKKNLNISHSPAINLWMSQRFNNCRLAFQNCRSNKFSDEPRAQSRLRVVYDPKDKKWTHNQQYRKTTC